jgi:threonine/homoserine/homoserine lactone efflux protein
MPSLTPELLTALVVFALVASITPGPNNTMLMASGVNFGVRATAPHMAGVCAGFFVLVIAAGLVLGGLFAAFPALHGILKVVGAAYLLYLAWKIARSGEIKAGEAAKPQTFWQAAAFQWVNPKAWAMVLGALTAYAPPDRYVANVVLVALVFTVVNVPCILSWAAFGAALRGVLSDPGRLRLFNWTMAGLLVLSILGILAHKP